MLFMMRIYSKKQFFGILLLLCNKVKKIFLYGNYAAVSIGRDKIHVHRLIGLYLIGRRRCNNHFHHINSNKMDNRSVNIACVEPQIHISRHNKGRKPSTNAIRQTIAANHRRKGYRTNPHRGDVTPEQVYKMRIAGFSFNQISLYFRLQCIKRIQTKTERGMKFTTHCFVRVEDAERCSKHFS